MSTATARATATEGTVVWENYRFEVKLRQAVPDDFKIAPGVARYGWRYYLKSARTGRMEGPYILERDSNLKQFGEYMMAGMVWCEFEESE